MVILPIELELRKLGLSEKEARVYLAGLELGPNSAQSIAEKAGISRPTAYEIIKKLETKGLFRETKEKKKRYFTAQSPENILGTLRTQRKELDEKEREFVRIISALSSNFSSGKNEIKIYKNKEGLRELEEMISFADSSEIFIINPQNRLKPVFAKIKKRLGRLNIKETELNIKGTLIVFDKAVFLPEGKKQGYLFENPIIVNLIKSLLIKKRPNNK